MRKLVIGGAILIGAALQLAGFLHMENIAYGNGGNGFVSVKDVAPYFGALIVSALLLLGAFKLVD